MWIVIVKALQVLLALSILILIHEFGHFSMAKLFGIRVEKFYLFFDIGGKALFRFKKGETEYGIGWLPLGGYCKISGMVDESMDVGQLEKDPQPWEFRTHPAWQRLLVLAAGVLYNFIFAIIAYCCILGIWGQSYIRNEGSKIYPNALAVDMGFRAGDEILSFDEYVPETFTELQADLARRNVRYVKVLRGEDTLKIYVDRNVIGDVLNSPYMFDLAIPFVVDSVAAGGVNASSSLVRGDRIIAFDGVGVEYLQESREILENLSGKQVDATVERGGDSLKVALQVDSTGRIGVYMRSPEVSVRRYGVLSSIPAGFKLAFSQMGGYVRDLGLLVKPSTGAYKSVGSFIAIGQVFPSTWDWYQFLSILALLSIMLGVMNLIPIPGLDGGHILFTIFEMITGKKPGERFLMATQMIGMILLIALMLLAFGNDITRLFK